MTIPLLFISALLLSNIVPSSAQELVIETDEKEEFFICSGSCQKKIASAANEYFQCLAIIVGSNLRRGSTTPDQQLKRDCKSEFTAALKVVRSSKECAEGINFKDDAGMAELIEECIKEGDKNDECAFAIEAMICPPGDVTSLEKCKTDIRKCPNGATLNRDPLNNCMFPKCPASLPKKKTDVVCATDMFECPDGSKVRRDPYHNCNFKVCPPQSTFCGHETKWCPSGFGVNRDPENNCEFKPCPETTVVLPECEKDTFECPNGAKVKRDPRHNCNFEICPATSKYCGHDVKWCPDGFGVSRDPNNNCEFKPCPKSELVLPVCTTDMFDCPDGSKVGRDPKHDCTFKTCPPLVKTPCKHETFWCPSGFGVKRDPNNNCEFKPCPVAECEDDVKVCDDGTEVTRDIDAECEFKACP